VACDFSLGMLQAGQARQVKNDPFQAKTRGRVAFAAGDALRLPFRDGAFDAVTISFGLRNVHGTREALEEMRRVTRPGGRLVVCEFSEITIAPLDMLYRRYLTGVLPAIARRAARNPVAYEYLSESIKDWPAQRELADVIRAAGWSSVRWRDLTLGVVAVHVARNL
jgi:demethylmenaquinone methyltransferase/2-methoxy-6-polyprenyl-1,4-benzoquinol methylase